MPAGAERFDGKASVSVRRVIIREEGGQYYKSAASSPRVHN